MKLNKLTILMGVGAIAYGTANLALVNTNAALTAPTNYDFAYRPISTGGTYYYLLEQKNGLYDYDPGYTRTTDGAYYNYTTTLTRDNYGYLPLGLDITMTFNRSNSSWASTGTGLYRPTDTKIGSDNTVGSILNKIYLSFDNQTSQEYLVYLDLSSGPDATVANIKYDNNSISTYYGNTYLEPDSSFFVLFIPSYINTSISFVATSNIRYFDAWYLKDLGVSAAYDNGYGVGYDAGYDVGYDNGYDVGFGDGTSGMGMSSIFTIAFGIVETIFNIQVLGDITLGTIIIAPIAIALLWFILGIVSGVGGKKQ